MVIVVGSFPPPLQGQTLSKSLVLTLSLVANSLSRPIAIVRAIPLLLDTVDRGAQNGDAQRRQPLVGREDAGQTGDLTQQREDHHIDVLAEQEGIAHGQHRSMASRRRG
jgi:hypothetical protein